MVTLIDRIRRERLVIVIRARSRAGAVRVGTALLDAGAPIIEVTMTTPDAPAAITALVERAGTTALVGAGTVLTGEDVEIASSSGATFLVTPGLTPSVDAAVARGVPVIAGAWTPSEVYAAHTAGATAVKVFPASVGGPAYLRALRDPLPDVPLIAVGGVGLAVVPEYLAAGAIGVGVGGPLIEDAETGDLDALQARLDQYLRACREQPA